MARIVFPLSGPPVGLMSIVFGDLDESTVKEPTSVSVPILAVYLPPSSIRKSSVLRWSRTSIPPISAFWMFHLPTNALRSAAASADDVAPATATRATHRANRTIGHLGVTEP